MPAFASNAPTVSSSSSTSTTTTATATATTPAGSHSHSVFARFRRQTSHGNASSTDLTLDVGAAAAPAAPSVNTTIHIDERGAVSGGKPNPHRRDSSLFSLTNSVTGSARDLGTNVKRSISLRSHRTNPSSGSSSLGNKARSPVSGHDFTPLSSASPIESPQETEHPQPPPAIAPTQAPLLKRKLSLSAKGLTHKFKSTEALPTLNSSSYLDAVGARHPPIIRTESLSSMLATQTTANAPSGRKPSADSRPGLHPQGSFSRDISSSHSNGAPLQPTTSAAPSIPSGPLNPNTIYSQIVETSTKRMATIDYMRKLHEGDIYHFGTYHYSQGTLAAMPSMQQHKLARRATNYFVLGYSLPALLDMNAGNALEYLKALSSLLTEFEAYQNLSGFDASGNMVSRGRMGQMFKSGMGFGTRTGKGRRSSTAITPDGLSIDPRQADLLGVPNSGKGFDASLLQDMSSPINPTGHEFAFLLTPHIPFEPDFLTTLGTLCDTLIDTYAKLMDLVAGPESCTPTVGDAFGKADKAIRKIFVANVVREFEETTRAGMKQEMAGLSKLTLGGLM